MSKRIFSFGLSLLLAISCFSSVLAKAPEFSADMVITDAKGKTNLGKVYIKGNEKIRQESTADGETSVIILRLDKKVSWTLLPDNQYMEVKMPVDPNQPNPEFEYDTAELGNETVNGYPCKIVQYTYKKKKYGVLKQWVSEKLGYSVKIESKDAKGKITLIEYKNIKEGKQPDSLFEIPKGYEKFSLSIKIPGL
ncbi:MAG: outer membrane lipoprotein carrier protein LolA [Firmicutes bacterium]|nr:outer membrane lipoprotein carrier protein LolA [Bacillota bacterium]